MTSIKKVLLQHPNYSAKSLIRRAAAYKYISFDAFDTLIKRAVAKPEDVFLLAADLLIEREKLAIKPEQLAQARRNADIEAKKKKPHQEVTLDDIYAELPGEYQDIAPAYRAAELETERAVCHADPVMKKVYDWCREQHKKIIVISDIYLDQDFMAELLSRCGYTGYEALYVSSRYGVTKQSGALYGEVYKRSPLAKGQVLHIGDSIQRDLLQARRQHFSAKLIARDPQRSKYIKINDLPEEQRKVWRRLRTVINGYEDTQCRPSIGTALRSWALCCMGSADGCMARCGNTGKKSCSFWPGTAICFGRRTTACMAVTPQRTITCICQRRSCGRSRHG